ncbi:histidine phosphatase family protein [Rhizobium sp. KVB221]|uniref:Histidine phosphatase family protein n=1 Tax=Rhizobium setariae TaxID=2801340 RepID=A0A937CN63_9HYPH|nr:histidine phosphatase family protein [Rhizobium setariae]
MTLFIIRHGQTDWNAEWRLQGQKDIPLNALGRRQATENGVALKALAGDLARYRFVSSPLVRARETTELVRVAAGLDATGYTLDERLREICFGDWEGKTLKEVRAVTPELVAARRADKWHFLAPGADAESYDILSRRVGDWLDSVDRPTVAVCHGGIIRCIFKLTGALDSAEAASIEIPQDQILKYQDGKLEWIASAEITATVD